MLTAVTVHGFTLIVHNAVYHQYLKLSLPTFVYGHLWDSADYLSSIAQGCIQGSFIQEFLMKNIMEVIFLEAVSFIMEKMENTWF